MQSLLPYCPSTPDLLAEKSRATPAGSRSRAHIRLGLILCSLLFLLHGTLRAQAPQYSYAPPGTSGNAFPLNTSTSNKVQWVYLPGDFAPVLPGNVYIDAIYIKQSTTSQISTATITDFTVAMANTSVTGFSSGPFQTGLTTVLSSPSYTLPVNGTNFTRIPLATPFFYNGGNLILEMSASNNAGLNLQHNYVDTGRRIYGNRLSPTGQAATGQLILGFDVQPVITNTPARITSCAGTAVTISFSNVLPVSAGNVYTAQLSDETGSFASPVNIGTLNSTAATGTISTTIPAGTLAGSGYRIRVNSSNPALTGSANNADIAVLQPGSRLYVDSSVASSGNGASWSKAFKSVSEALNFVNSNTCANEVWVRSGTYYPMAGATVATSRDSAFRIRRAGVKVYGGFAGTETSVTQRNIAANPTILSGDLGIANDTSDNAYHVFTITTTNGIFDTATRLDGFTLANGNGYNATGGATINGIGVNRQDGGGLYLSAGANGLCSPTIANCILTNNFANFGAGMYCSSLSSALATVAPLIVDCSFRQNTARTNGGAIFFQAATGVMRPVFTGTSFTFNNSAESSGGGIYSNYDTCTYTNCTFANNASPISGGAIFGNGDKMQFTNCAFTANTAVNSGGGVYGTGDTMRFSNCLFTGNITSGTILSDGGAVTSANASWLALADCTFESNSAPGNRGGAVGITGNSSITRCTFNNNFSYAGGALSNVGGGRFMLMTDCRFTNNSSTTSGGAIISQFNSSATITGTAFINNVSGGNGGVLYSQNTGFITMTNDTMINNRAASNGGGVAFNGNPGLFNRCYFNGNRQQNAGGAGGAIYATDSVRITNSTFLRDTATNGAAIFSINARNIYCSGNFLAYNVSSQGSGGAIFLNRTNDSVLNNVFYANKVIGTGGGGGLTLLLDTLKVNNVINNTFYRDTAGGNGGAIYAYGGLGTARLYNNLAWDNKSAIGGGIYLAATNATISSSNNFQAIDPLFTSPAAPAGADDTWGTADDGLQLQPCSRAIAYGQNAAVSGVGTDALLNTRIQQATVDAGAYESSYPSTSIVPLVDVTVNPSTVIPTRTTPITFTASSVNGGASPSYQWKLNGAVVANTSTYTNNAWKEGDVVTCLLNSNVACPYPNPVWRDQVIHLKPVVTLTAPYNCVGAPLALTSTPPANRIIWQLNGAPTDTNYATWNANATTVAGGNGQGAGLNQLSNPAKVIVDNLGNIYVGDEYNHRVVKWAPGATNGVIVAGTTQGVSANQLYYAWGVSPNGNGDVFVADENNMRIQKWSPPYTTGVTVAGGNGAGSDANQLASPYGLFVDSSGTIYIADGNNHRIQKWVQGATAGVTVAGGNGQGSAANQLNTPTDVVADKAGNIYVLDAGNSRVQKWSPPYTTGVTVAGGNGSGNGANQINGGQGLAVDGIGAVYVAEGTANRIARWLPGATAGTVVAGGNGAGNGASQLSGCKTVALDTAGNLYVADRNNHRIQKFATNTVLTHGTPLVGNYKATVTTFAGISDTSVSVPVTALTPPAVSITASPATTVCAGTNVTFTAVPVNGGATPVYQWRKNGVNTGSNLPTYSDNALANGDVITVRLTSNSPCRNVDTANSNAVTVTVNTVPAQPGAITGNTKVCGGTAQTYSVPAVTGATSYAWSLPTGWSGASTTNTINATATSASGIGVISVTANNGCGASIARTLADTVINTPAQPAAITGNNNVCAGTAQIYRIPRTGDAAAYTWTVTGNGWTRAPGSPADTFVNATAGTAGIIISVTALNSCGTSPQRTLAIGVTNIPAQPGIIAGRDSLCAGSGDLYTIAGVTEATSYVWTVPATGGFTGAAGNGGLNFSLTSASATPAGTYVLTVQAANFCGTSVARGKTIAVNVPVTPAVSITTTTTTICAGQGLTFTATGTNAGPAPLYQWRINGVNSGAPSAATTFTPAVLNNNDVVSVALTSSLPCATVTPAQSNQLRITVNPVVTPGVSINSNYPANIICRGTPVTFTISALTGGGTAPTYQWTKNGVNVGTGAATYTDAGLNTGDSVSVTLTSNAVCVTQPATQSNKIGNTVYTSITPTVNVLVNPGTQITQGQSVIFTAQVANVGPNPQYQWLKNGAGIVGATSATYTTNALVNGDQISVRVGADLPCASPGVVTSVPKTISIPSTSVGTVSGVADISLYPNPSDGHFTVSVRGYAAGKVLKVSVVNLIGQVVHQVTAHGSQAAWTTMIDLPQDIASGAYLVRFSDERDVNIGTRKIDIVR